MASAPAANNNAQTFPCTTCGKPFASVHALGGHQNAHRRERFALKRQQIEMKRHLARQSHQQHLLPRSVSGSSASASATATATAARFPVNPPPAVNANVPAQAAAAAAAGGGNLFDQYGLDLTLKL